MTSAKTEFRYDRPAGLDGHDSLSEIARLVPERATVLDLGAATGALGAHLRESKGCTVDGAELDAGAAASARPHYRTLLQLDLETARLADHFPAATYDAIVCADVLEHLRDPGRVLDQLAPLLAPGGRVLISIPNVGYAGVVAGLLEGEFEYSQTGLLDSTHLRFFTRKSLLALLDQHGFHAHSITPLVAQLADSEFRDHRLEALPPAVSRALLAQPDAFTYQFLVEALPGRGIAPAPPAPPAPRFGLQVYWSPDEAHCAHASGVIGEARQRVELVIPPQPQPPSTLRFDPADRPGYLRVHALTLRDAAGAELWSWDRDPASLRAYRQLIAAGPLWILGGDDPSVELPVPPPALARLQAGGTLAVDLDWPMSTDFHVAATLVDQHERKWQAERALLLAQLASVSAATDPLRRELSAARSELDQQLRRVQAEQVRISSRQDQAQHQLHRVSERLSLLERVPGLQKVLGRTRRELMPAPVELAPVAGPGVRELTPGVYESTGSDPHFDLRPQGRRFPSGWVQLEFEAAAAGGLTLRPDLYLDVGLGYTEASIVHLPPPVNGVIRTQLRLPEQVWAMRFDPLDEPGRFTLGRLRLTEMGKLRTGLRLARPIARELLEEPDRIPAALGKAVSIFRKDGLRGLKHKLLGRSRGPGGPVSYPEWVAEFDTITSADEARIEEAIAQLTQRPVFSILMPVYNTPEKWLRRAIESVRQQLYQEWELCIADDASTAPHVRAVLQEAAAKDPRIKVAFREKNGHISAASNSALSLATGEFVALLDHDDELPPHALYLLAAELNEHPDTDLVYSDEDKIDEQGNRYDPHFKPDWNPELLSSQMYIAHLAAYRASLVRKAGGFREGCEGSQDLDLCLRVTGLSSAGRIRHVPHVLYHWRSIEGSTAAQTGNKDYAVKAGLKALRDFWGARAQVSEGKFPTTYRVRHELPEPAPLVSLLIPTRDGYKILEQCIRSIREKTLYPNYEIIIVDNQSRDPQALEYLQRLAREGVARVLPYDAPFNYSAINNFAVREARGEVVVLLNNDVEVIAPDWLGELVSQAVRPGIGAVGAKLLYPDGTIQHAGVLIGMFGVAGHQFRVLPGDAPGYFGRAQLVQNLSACTAACLAVRKAVYEEVGGLDEEHLKVAFNDVDFCLRVQQAGYRNVYTPYAELYHHESVTRGYEDTPEKKARFKGEIEQMKKTWGEALRQDRAYNPNLSLESFYFELAWPPRTRKPWDEPDDAG